MKKATLLIIVMLLAMTALFAEEKGVMLISSGSNTEKGSPEDMKVDKEVKIDKFGKIKLTEVKEVDSYAYQYNSYWGRDDKWNSGTEANYLYIKADILNTNKEDYDYLKKCTVTAYYDDGFVYSGWAEQFNWDNSKQYRSDKFAIKPMYYGHYGFFVTLPNSILEDTAPLKIVVKMDDVEFTYYVRK